MSVWRKPPFFLLWLNAASGITVACVTVINSATAIWATVVVGITSSVGCSACSYHPVEKNAIFVVEDSQFQTFHEVFEIFVCFFHRFL